VADVFQLGDSALFGWNLFWALFWAYFGLFWAALLGWNLFWAVLLSTCCDIREQSKSHHAVPLGGQ
jgi:hypothetical protein